MSTICVLNRAGGIGDALYCLPIAAGFKARSADDYVTYLVPYNSVQWIQPFNGYDCLGAVGSALAKKPDVTYDVNACYQKEMSTKAVRMDLYSEFADNVIPSHPTLKTPFTHAIKDAVLLFPFSDWACRAWALPNWLQLESCLRDQGERVVICSGKHNDGISSFKSERLVGLDPARLYGLITESKISICNDSGPAHMAGILGKKCIALCGPTNGDKVFSFWPSVRSVNGGLACSGCNWVNLPSQDCNKFCASLNQLHPLLVMEHVKAYLRDEACVIDKSLANRLDWMRY